MATLCDSGAVKLMAGVNVSTSINTGYDTIIPQAEGYICSATQTNWVDTYSGLNTDVKSILEQATAAHAAIQAIMYDMDGYTSQSQAISQINANITIRDDLIKLLKEKYVTKFISNA